jgi:hypothetical protein
MNRRRFLEGSYFGLGALCEALADGDAARASLSRPPREVQADVVIVGGGLGGCAAALTALENNLTVILTEPTDWIGGQLTAQAVPPDEHQWIERLGRNARYQKLRQGIRDYYRHHFPLTREARADEFLNPGRGSVSRLCHEPRAALAMLTALLAPHASGGRLLVLLEHEPIAAESSSDRVRAVVVVDKKSQTHRVLLAQYYLDATETGELLPIAGVEFVAGAEAQAQTGEPHGLAMARPDVQQAITCCFAMDYLDGQDHTIERPAEYDFWRGFVPVLDHPWPGKLLDLTYCDPITLKPVNRGFDPRGEGTGLWVYRRIVDPRNFRPGTYPASTGITLVNWPQNDYWLGPLIGAGVSQQQAEAHVARAKQLSLSLLYWLQTECPRNDGKAGWKGLRLRPDVVGTEDGLAKAPYIRESRRIQAELTVLEQHVGAEARRRQAHEQSMVAETFADSVGVGSYRIDLHPSSGGLNYIDISSLPFQIPLGALIPRRIKNLLPACKNLGTSHITNGCFRLHPVEWAIGEATGALVAFCLETKLSPSAVRNTSGRMVDFQSRLTQQGVELEWPKVLPR